MAVDPEELKAVVEKFVGTEDLPAKDEPIVKSFITKPTEDTIDSKLRSEEKASSVQPEPDITKSSEAGEIRNQLASMGVPGRIKLALFGNAVCRALLIRDTNKLIQQFVLKNPKLTEKEVEEFSRNPYLSEFVLRSIADSRMYMKSNVIRYNLVVNPKTPQDIALKWLRYLQLHEIKRIAKSKNLPQLIATSAKKMAAVMERK